MFVTSYLHKYWLHAEWHSTLTAGQRHWQLTPTEDWQPKKYQIHLLCWPQSKNSCTCAQEGQQHQCDLCLLLASQVSYLAAGNTLRDKNESGRGGKSKHTHISLAHKIYRSYNSKRQEHFGPNITYCLYHMLSICCVAVTNASPTTSASQSSSACT